MHQNARISYWWFIADGAPKYSPRRTADLNADAMRTPYRSVNVRNSKASSTSGKLKLNTFISPREALSKRAGCAGWKWSCTDTQETGHPWTFSFCEVQTKRSENTNHLVWVKLCTDWCMARASYKKRLDLLQRLYLKEFSISRARILVQLISLHNLPSRIPTQKMTSLRGTKQKEFIHPHSSAIGDLHQNSWTAKACT